MTHEVRNITHRPNGTKPTDQTELNPPIKPNQTHRPNGTKPNEAT